jgi:hypothetical protein
VLAALTTLPGHVYRTNFATTTTAPARTSPFALAAAGFQRCLGVSNRRDRVFGLAGQQPSYQVSSPIFTNGPVQVVTYAQYYPHPSEVAHDTAELRRAGFGACYARANGTLLQHELASQVAVSVGPAQSVTPRTFARGFRAGGEVRLVAPSFLAPDNGASRTQSLGVYVVTNGHFEVSLFVLAMGTHQPASLVATLTNEAEARISASPASAV